MADHSGAQFDAPILACLQTIFDRHAGPDQRWNKEQVDAFFHHIQGEDPQQDLEGGLDFERFLRYMTSPLADALAPVLEQDLSWSLNNYFVSSSHNTYLTGNQLTSDASTEAYKNVLLQGCRCIEIDVWDGGERFTDAADEAAAETLAGEKLGFRMRTLMKVSGWVAENLVNEKGKKDMAEIQQNWGKLVATEPRVLHGHTLTKEISFRDVCATVKEYAFQTSDLPVVVSLEVHCSPPQQEMMVSIMNDIWGDHLLPPVELDAMEEIAPSPAALRNKILVKVKYVPPKEGGRGGEESTMNEEDTKDRAGLEAEEGAPAKNAKPPKIIAQLSRLGIFTRGVSFRAMEQAEAAMPHHVFSLSEGLVEATHRQAAPRFFAHNQRFLMRSYPAGTRVDSSNPDPAGHWRKGIQFVALNWQNHDAGMLLNDALFAGSGGYVLKPDGYRDDRGRPAASTGTTTGPEEVPRRTLHHFSVGILAVQNLPLPPDVRDGDGLHPYLAVRLSVEPHPLETTPRDPCLARTQTRQGIHPDFGQEVLGFDNDIEDITPELSFVVFQVWDDRPGVDALVAGACLRLDRIKTGYRFLRLKDRQGADTNSIILVKIEKRTS